MAVCHGHRLTSLPGLTYSRDSLQAEAHMPCSSSPRLPQGQLPSLWCLLWFLKRSRSLKVFVVD